MNNQPFMNVSVDPINENEIDTKYEISMNMVKKIYTKQEVIIF